MNSRDAPFYLASIPNPASQTWFKKQPLGKNSLGSFMKSMSDTAGLSGRHTNHSVRRTMISTLRKENVEPLNIITLAGQRNLKSLDSYSSTSMEQQKDMSAKLSNITAPDQVRTPVKSTESKFLKPSIAAQQSEKPENSGKNLFTGAVFYRGLYRTSITFSLNKKNSDFYTENPNCFFRPKKKISDFCTENPRFFFRPNKNFGFLHWKSRDIFFRPKKKSRIFALKIRAFFSSKKKSRIFALKNPRFFFSSRKNLGFLHWKSEVFFFGKKKISHFCTENPSAFFFRQKIISDFYTEIRVFFVTWWNKSRD